MAKVCWVDTRILIHSNKTGLPFRDNSNKSQNYTDKPPKTKKLGRLCGCSEPFEVESESAGQRSRRVNGRQKQRFAPFRKYPRPSCTPPPGSDPIDRIGRRNRRKVPGCQRKTSPISE